MTSLKGLKYDSKIQEITKDEKSIHELNNSKFYKNNCLNIECESINCVCLNKGLGNGKTINNNGKYICADCINQSLDPLNP